MHRGISTFSSPHSPNAPRHIHIQQPSIQMHQGISTFSSPHSPNAPRHVYIQQPSQSQCTTLT
jgi:hypothetical protein